MSLFGVLNAKITSLNLKLKKLAFGAYEIDPRPFKFFSEEIFLNRYNIPAIKSFRKFVFVVQF